MAYLIVIPTYNEVENISSLLEKINSTLIGYDFSVLVVDDNSTDGTKDVLSELKLKYPNLFVLERSEKLGLASAYIDGFKFGLKKGFNYFIQFDADFSHNPIYLPQMFDELLEFDVVIGSRNIKNGGVKNWGILRNLISKGGSFYSRLVLNCPIHDLTGGFNGWRKDVLEKINFEKIISKGYCFQIEMKYRAFKNGARIKEFPIIFKDRTQGKSKMSKNIFFEALLNVLKIRFNKN